MPAVTQRSEPDDRFSMKKMSYHDGSFNGKCVDDTTECDSGIVTENDAEMNLLSYCSKRLNL